MRRLLVERARARRRITRGGGAKQMELDEHLLVADDRAETPGGRGVGRPIFFRIVALAGSGFRMEGGRNERKDHLVNEKAPNEDPQPGAEQDRS
jgi:hypothetical protein